ncbi:hypothetical protein DCAR_0102322 [Daucus carota subsp. sativus]|uniref:Association with the SNF1 complex (ASC) domain-containing protein n=1 Tax=Daucus carota subsp. sativus TaxID=79200 RepID=A0AAF0W7L9_DAUCS|nr:hypothetical protein DCAR_0102322 [Daucus carota subsp. sativus]
MGNMNGKEDGKALDRPSAGADMAPVVPLQRPEEMHIPIPSYMQTTCEFGDMSHEQGIQTMITWSYDAKEVFVEGSWDDWKTRKPLQRLEKDFTIMKVLRSGLVLNLQSPDSSYNNTKLSAEDFAKEPPLVPPHLQMTLLNGHVVLNHLYGQKGRASPSVVVLGSTHRFLSKYVMVVLYKSKQR